MTSQKSPYSSIFKIFFLYQNLSSFAWIKTEKPWRSSIFWVPHPRKVPTSMVVGEIPELPELPISHNLTALDGSKTSALAGFLDVFFLGGRSVFLDWIFFAFKCCSLLFSDSLVWIYGYNCNDHSFSDSPCKDVRPQRHIRFIWFFPIFSLRPFFWRHSRSLT